MAQRPLDFKWLLRHIQLKNFPVGLNSNINLALTFSRVLMKQPFLEILRVFKFVLMSLTLTARRPFTTSFSGRPIYPSTRMTRTRFPHPVSSKSNALRTTPSFLSRLGTSWLVTPNSPCFSKSTGARVQTRTCNAWLRKSAIRMSKWTDLMIGISCTRTRF